jgi:drug/metabolite transporter (DMT)-like permease
MMEASAPPFPLAGEAASLGAALIWSGSISLFTKYAADIPAPVMNFFKSTVAVICLAVAAALTAPVWGTDPWALAVLATSGVVGISLGDTALFGALKRLGAQITSSSQCLAPPIAAGIAALVLGETLSLRETLGMLITAGAVSGIILFSRRRGAHLAQLERATLFAGLGLAFFAALCQGAGLVMSRQALQSVDVLYGTLARIMPALLVLTVILIFSGNSRRLHFVVREPRRAAILAAASFAGTFLGLLLMSAGVKYTKTGIAAALNSTYPIWIIPIAHFILKERVSWQAVVCTCVAVVGIALMLL